MRICFTEGEWSSNLYLVFDNNNNNINNNDNDDDYRSKLLQNLSALYIWKK